MDTAGPPQDKGAHKGLRLLAERLDLEEKLKAVDEQGRSWLADHPMTILSLVFSGLFIFAAQPIAATFTDLPSAALLSALGWDSGIARSLGLWLFIVMLGGGWLGAHMVTVVHRAEFGPQPQRKPNPIVYVQKRVQGLLMAVFVHPVGRFSQRQRRIAGVMAIALSSAIWLWVGLQVRDTPGAGASEAIGWLALLWLTGVWLVFSSYDSMRLPGV